MCVCVGGGGDGFGGENLAWSKSQIRGIEYKFEGDLQWIELKGYVF